MDVDGLLSINELQSFLEEIEALAPTRQAVEGTRVSYRQTSTDETVEDSLPLEDTEEEFSDSAQQDDDFNQARFEPVANFSNTQTGPVIAVDCGIARLGETENGLVIALRASVVTVQNGQTDISLFRSGPMYLHNGYKLPLLYQMGQHLGKPDQFVEVDTTDPDNPRPTKVKAGMAHDAHKYGDRFRNWFERLTQKIAVTKIENGIIILDGALTLRTLDTPDAFIKGLASSAGEHGNALLAISKQSLLQVDGRPIRFCLDDAPSRPCYRSLTTQLRREDNERVLGNVYAVRFSALGPTFRMDVKASAGQSDNEAIDQFWSSSLMRGGYPDILVRAHTHSYFTSPDVLQLQAQSGAKYSLMPRNEVDLSGIFGPFGGRFK